MRRTMTRNCDDLISSGLSPYDPGMPSLAKRLLAAVLAVLPGIAVAQRVLDFPQDLAFKPAEVNAYAAAAFGARLKTLAAAARLDTDRALKVRLQRIFPRIARAAAYEQPAAAAIVWEIHTCSGRDENASALPGGKLLVSSDFVERLALTDDELGYLLAHEVGHVLAQHTREYATVARYFVDNGRRRDYADIQRELDENLSVNLRMAPVSAHEELEADSIGFVLGAHAGFAPEAMLSLLGKLGDAHSFARTHPSQAARLAQARGMLETARRLAAAPLPRD